MKYLFIILSLWAINNMSAQSKPKSNNKSQQNQMMIEAMRSQGLSQEEIDKAISMMDSLGVDLPSTNGNQNISNQQLNQAWEDEDRIVPQKDNTRIASISKTSLNSQNILQYLQNTHNNVSNLFEETEKGSYQEFYTWLKKKENNPTATGNAAVGLWMMGKPRAALYVMGKACIDNPDDIDNLNNYAALITMIGGEQLAIPVLNYLNGQYPKNSTILNNLAQAWFGLGDMDKASNYIDSTLMLCAWHPQVNMIKSRIEEEKGNKTEAINTAKKAIRNYYSKDKENRLRKLGYKINSKDIYWSFKPDSDPLGLANFKHPDFPLSADQEVGFEKDWKQFREQCNSAIDGLNQQLKQAELLMTTKQNKRKNETQKTINKVINTGNGNVQINVMPFYANKAILKLKSGDEDGGVNFRIQKAIENKANYIIKHAPLESEYGQTIEKLQAENEEQSGEGKPNVDYCPKYKDATDKFLESYNSEWQQLCDEYLHQFRLKINEEVYWYQFVQWPEQFEVTKLTFKIGWLQSLRDLNYKTSKVDFHGGCIQEEKNQKGGKLANFNDIHCDYHSEMDLVYGKIKNDCDIMTTSIDLDVLDLKIFKAELKQDYGDNKNTFADQFESCTIEAGVKKGDGIGKGPLKIEAELGANAFVEIDRKGISDLGIKVSADVNVGTNAGEGEDISKTIIGAEAKISINGGFTLEGKGIGKGLTK